jgi:hypothetical protein
MLNEVAPQPSGTFDGPHGLRDPAWCIGELGNFLS